MPNKEPTLYSTVTSKEDDPKALSMNEVQIPTIVTLVGTTHLSSLRFNADADSEGEVEHVYDETKTFMASGNGYVAKSLYEHMKETMDDDSYDDVEYNVHDLSEDQLALCYAWDIKIRGRKKL